MTDLRLSLSEQRFRDFVLSSDHPVAVIGRDDRIVLVNPKFTDEFGYTENDIPHREALLGKAFPEPEDRKKAVDLLDSDNVPSNGSFTIRCRDGEKKEISFRPVRLSDGTVVVGCEAVPDAR